MGDGFGKSGKLSLRFYPASSLIMLMKLASHAIQTIPISSVIGPASSCLAQLFLGGSCPDLNFQGLLTEMSGYPSLKKKDYFSRGTFHIQTRPYITNFIDMALTELHLFHFLFPSIGWG